MNSRYTGDYNILLETIHTPAKRHVTLRNHNKNTALERIVIDYWVCLVRGGGGAYTGFNGSKPSPFVFVVRNIWSAGFLTHQ